MLKNITNKIPSKYRNVLAIAGLAIFLIGGIAISWYLSRYSLIFKPHATGGTTVGLTVAGGSTVVQSQSTAVKVMMYPNGKKVTAAELIITTDPGLSIQSIAASGTAMPQVLLPGTVVNAQKATITLGCPISAPVETSVEVATVTVAIDANASGNKKVYVDSATQVSAIGFPSNVLDETQDAILYIMPPGTATPTVTTTVTGTPTVSNATPPVTTTVPVTTTAPVTRTATPTTTRTTTPTVTRTVTATPTKPVTGTPTDSTGGLIIMTTNPPSTNTTTPTSIVTTTPTDEVTSTPKPVDNTFSPQAKTFALIAVVVAGGASAVFLGLKLFKKL